MPYTVIRGVIPSHMSCEITHNEHKNYYRSLKEHLENLWNGERPSLDELTNEEYQRCIDTDQFWEIRWYPSTPISFFVVYAPTIEECFYKMEHTIDEEYDPRPKR